MPAHLISGIGVIMMLTLPMAAPVSAQSLQARKIPDAQFIRVEFIKFRPGGEDRAFELEDKYFTPAWKRSGLTPPLELHLQTGPWDRIYVYELKSGMAEMEWQVSPDRARFLNALSTIAGGEREALRITAEWDGLVERRESYVGHRHPVH
ncbi:MAG TPA: hypothetical protein VF098_09070 [Sphingomicrobium sp.]